MLRPTTPRRRLGLLRGRYDVLLDRIILMDDYLHRMSSMYMSSHTMSIHYPSASISIIGIRSRHRRIALLRELAGSKAAVP